MMKKTALAFLLVAYPAFAQGTRQQQLEDAMAACQWLANNGRADAGNSANLCKIKFPYDGKNYTGYCEKRSDRNGGGIVCTHGFSLAVAAGEATTGNAVMDAVEKEKAFGGSGGYMIHPSQAWSASKCAEVVAAALRGYWKGAEYEIPMSGGFYRCPEADYTQQSTNIREYRRINGDSAFMYASEHGRPPPLDDKPKCDAVIDFIVAKGRARQAGTFRDNFGPVLNNALSSAGLTNQQLCQPLDYTRTGDYPDGASPAARQNYSQAITRIYEAWRQVPLPAETAASRQQAADANPDKPMCERLLARANEEIEKFNRDPFYDIRNTVQNNINLLIRTGVAGPWNADGQKCQNVPYPDANVARNYTAAISNLSEAGKRLSDQIGAKANSISGTKDQAWCCGMGTLLRHIVTGAPKTTYCSGTAIVNFENEQPTAAWIRTNADCSKITKCHDRIVFRAFEQVTGQRCPL